MNGCRTLLQRDVEVVRVARGSSVRGPKLSLLWRALATAFVLASAWTVGVAAAQASLGELSFIGCLGKLEGCTAVPVGLTGAVEVPKSLAVSPDGANVYAADQNEAASAIDIFSRNTTSGTLTLTSCIGELSGCTPTSPAKAVERPFAVTLSPDGKSVYAAAVGSNVVDEFSRDPGTGALTLIGCVGQLTGCSSTTPADAVSAPISVTVSADGSSVYVSSDAGAVDEFQRDATTGALTFEGCIGAEVGGCTVPSKPNSMHALGDVVISPDGTSVYVGSETGSIAAFARNTSTGALTFTECIGYLPECNRPSVYFAINEPLSLAISPDGANLYAGNFNNGLIDVLSREAGTGKLTFTGCNGHFAEEPAACAEPPKGVPEGPLRIAISPDGADLYVASDSSVSEFARGPGGALSYAGCVGQVSEVCGETSPAEAVFFQISLALSSNGANLYSGSELSHDVDVFGRTTPPVVGAPPASTQTPASTAGSGSSSTPGIASTPQAIEELELGCTKRTLVLNDVLIHGDRVDLEGSAAKSLDGKKVKIVFDGGSKAVASATVGANGEFATTAPLPSARLRDSNSARYMAESGSQRSLDLKLTRRLSLEPPRFSDGTVTLVGQVLPPLTKPVAKIAVQQELECGKTSVVAHVTPSASGHFRIVVQVPAAAKAGLYRLTSSVRENTRSKRGFATYSLPLPVILG